MKVRYKHVLKSSEPRSIKDLLIELGYDISYQNPQIIGVVVSRWYRKRYGKPPEKNDLWIRSKGGVLFNAPYTAYAPTPELLEFIDRSAKP